MYSVTTDSRHPIAHIVFHPNGTTFAVAQPNYGVTMLDRISGQVAGTIPVPKVSDYASMLITANGERLALGSARGVTVCDTATGKQLLQSGKYTLAGAILAECKSGLLAATQQGLRELRILKDMGGTFWNESVRPVQSKAAIIAMSPCGRWGFGVYGRVKPALLDLGTGRIAMAVDHPYRSELVRPRERPTVTFAANGARFAVCDGKDVRVYDTPSDSPDDDEDDTPNPSLVQRSGNPTAPKPRALLEPTFILTRPQGVDATDRWQPLVAFTPNGGGLLIRRPRNRVQLWDVTAGAHIGEWSWRIDGLMCLAIAPDGLTAVAGARFGHVIVWDLE